MATGVQHDLMKQTQCFWSMLDELAETDEDAYRKFMATNLQRGQQELTPAKPWMCVKTRIMYWTCELLHCHSRLQSNAFRGLKDYTRLDYRSCLQVNCAHITSAKWQNHRVREPKDEMRHKCCGHKLTLVQAQHKTFRQLRPNKSRLVTNNLPSRNQHHNHSRNYSQDSISHK
ncbi:uncharacterized protein LOC119733312 [Patiria miniata]|uniref:Uncharacterized protein n=1 Tax=Patiria miniata TaxID=46514 RepID=A0A914AH41_PATMI|nr:uncharacterized protein LOC119733312 [Patiria miniata]